MDSRSIEILVSALQAILGFGLGTLFAYYWRVYRRPHLRLWSASFHALGLYLVLSTVALQIALADPPGPMGVRTTVSLLSQIMVYVHLATLALGTLALRAGQAPAGFLTRGAIGAAVAVGVAATLAFAFDPAASEQRIFVRVGLRYLAAAAVYFGVGLALISNRGWSTATPGQRIVAVAFAGFGLAAAANFAVLTLPPADALAMAGMWLNLIDLAAAAAIGTGLVVWLHDDERLRAQRASDTVERLTFFDQRTGLPNRRLFVDRLVERLIEADIRNERVAVLAVRPDRARMLRAALGETAIDSLVARIAVRLGEAAGTGSVIGRLDDDRLLVALSPVAGRDETSRRADALLSTLSVTVPAPGGGDLLVTCAIGFAVFPDDGEQAEELIAAATAAQAGAAAAGGHRSAPFSRNIGERNRADIVIASELRRALGSAEFEVHYQPVYDRKLRMVAAEALVRWRHPRRGLLLPVEFLAAAEGGGLVQDIDRLVLDTACRDIAARARDGVPPIRIAVNVAAQTFELPDFARLVERTLAAHGVAPQQLELEITEATAMRDLEQAARMTERIRGLGVALALDDFGVGYSSMSQLRHLAADTLKIDRSFTAGVEFDRRDAAIASALIRLGHSLDLRVVAEGVETVGQYDFFVADGADLLQGHYLARAVPTDALASLVAAGPPGLAA